MRHDSSPYIRIRAGSGDSDHLHPRYYSNTLGRFVSVDPAGGDVGSSQSWNRYAYVENNPIRMVDPDGRDGLDGGLIRNEHNTAMGVYPPATPVNLQKVAAFTAGLAVSVGLAELTAGSNVWLNMAYAGLSNALGGVVDRATDGDVSTAPLETRALLVETAGGVVGAGVAEKVMGVKAVKTSVDNVLGVGAARVLTNPASNVISSAVGAAGNQIGDPATPVGPNSEGQDPAVNSTTREILKSAEDVTGTQLFVGPPD